MKFLVDENVPQTIISHIRFQRHSVTDIKRTEYHGISDHELLALAVKEGRILLTYDKDFIAPLYLPPEAAIVICHFPRVKPVDVLPWIDQLLIELSTKAPHRPFRMMLEKESLTLLGE